MGIVAYCPNGHRIKVKDDLAGKKGICPTCAARFRIPLAGPGRDGATTTPAAGARAALEERPDLVWCVAELGGAHSAPLDATGMRAWLDSGAATAEHVVWRADWPEWRPVEEVFPGTLPPAGRRGT